MPTGLVTHERNILGRTLHRIADSTSEMVRPFGPGWLKVAGFLGIPFVACLLSYPLCRSNLYQRYADPKWVRAANQIYLAHNSDCQVLVYGDSSAITGIDPTLVARLTGLKTCNVAQTKGSLVVLGTQALDTFLRNNARPRVLLLQFSGADFYRPQNWSDSTAYMEGGIALLRYYNLRAVVPIVVRHPSLLLGMMHYAFITDPLNFFNNHAVHYEVAASPDSPVNVHLVLKQPAFKSCKDEVDTDPLFHAPDPKFVAALRAQYSRLADRVIIDVAPTSICDPHASYLTKTLSGIDNSLQRYPFSMFNEGYTHFTPEGAAHVSESIARQIAGGQRQTLQSDSGVQ